MQAITPTGPLRIDTARGNVITRSALSLFRPAAEWALALPKLNRIHEQIIRHRTDSHFIDDVLHHLGITINVDEEDLQRIPREGPLLVVANHPFGGLEGLVLHALLHRIRSDVKLLGNAVLGMIPELRDAFFFVERFGEVHDRRRRNIAAMRSALGWLEEGGVLGIFPAGQVSHARFTRPEPVDGPWSTTIARLVRRAEAPVLPVYFHGRNSLLFQMAGLVHRRLRTIMLPRELLNKRNTRVELQIGKPITAGKLCSFDRDDRMMDYLRVHTYILKGRCSSTKGGAGQHGVRASLDAEGELRLEPIIAPVDPLLCRNEVRTLPDEQCLLRQGSMQVIYARAPQIPNLLREVGRLREITFRAAGGGTGKACDLHRVDQYYLHLIVWNEATDEPVGAYRIGPTDEILPRHGKQGLFSSTVFHYQDEVLRRIDPALELGRAFVRQEYQREYAPLALLWKGIGHYVGRNPRYRYLFGSVSISDNYNTMSKQLLIAFLQMNKDLPALRKLIRPRLLPRFGRIRDWNPEVTGDVITDPQEVDRLISQIEADHRGMPVLLRQYLKLNGRLLGFGITRQFNNALDGLMLVDLKTLTPAILTRYAGKEGAQRIFTHHDMVAATAER